MVNVHTDSIHQNGRKAKRLIVANCRLQIAHPAGVGVVNDKR
jgi:hypothetical protein